MVDYINVFGGGLKVDTTTTNINANKGYITNLFGAGNEAGATTTNINIGKVLYKMCLVLQI